MTTTLIGSVVRRDSLMPVEGVEIEVRRSPPGAAVQGRTDSFGWFSFTGLQQGRWTVRYREPGGTSGQDDVELTPFVAAALQFELPMLMVVEGGRPAGEEPYEGKMTREGIVRCRVLDARSGVPVRDATVTILRAAGPVADIGHLTDAGGEVEFAGLCAGVGVFRALATSGATGEAGRGRAGGEVASLTILVGE
ncbi:hypothetical protein BH23PSE1_BH23PSE1_04580 [soil metagenome]